MSPEKALETTNVLWWTVRIWRILYPSQLNVRKYFRILSFLIIEIFWIVFQSQKCDRLLSFFPKDLDVVLSTAGKIFKGLGERFEMTLDVNASGTPETSWKKVESEYLFIKYCH